MREARKNGKVGGWRCRTPAGLLLLVPLSLTLTGCPSHKSEMNGDVLFGAGLKQDGTQVPPPPPPPNTKPQAAAPVVAPINEFSPTTATLASLPGIPGSRPLGIDGSGRPITSIQPASATSLPAAPATNAGVFQPVVMPVPRDNQPGPAVVAVNGINNWTPQAAPNSPAALISQVEALGGRECKFESVPEGYRFSTRISSRTDPSAFRVFEASHPDQATAVQAVLRQIQAQK
jgi:hypothetical protein